MHRAEMADGAQKIGIVAVQARKNLRADAGHRRFLHNPVQMRFDAGDQIAPAADGAAEQECLRIKDVLNVVNRPREEFIHIVNDAGRRLVARVAKLIDPAPVKFIRRNAARLCHAVLESAGAAAFTQDIAQLTNVHIAELTAMEVCAMNDFLPMNQRAADA